MKNLLNGSTVLMILNVTKFQVNQFLNKVKKAPLSKIKEAPPSKVKETLLVHLFGSKSKETTPNEQINIHILIKK